MRSRLRENSGENFGKFWGVHQEPQIRVSVPQIRVFGGRLTGFGTLWTIAASTGLVTRLKHPTAIRTHWGAGFVKAHGRGRTQPCSGKPSLRLVPQWVFSLLRTRTPSVSKGQSSAYACPAAWKERAKDATRCGTTHRIVQALIERLGQAWLNVTHRSSHPDESIRQAHLVWVRQMNCPDGDERKTPVTRWRYA
jgi:hypothetical protein